jgi:hypothetical protein
LSATITTTERAYSVSQLAERFSVKPHVILALIRAGELAAKDLRAPGAQRPHWRILPADLAEFERRRASKAEPARTRRRPEAMTAEPVGRRW